jgi:hypothetical protein
LTAVVALPLAGCANSEGIGGAVAPSAVSAPATASVRDAASGLKVGTLASGGRTDETLAKAGWTCIQPGNGLVLCAPPGLGLPSIPPVADGQPTYDITAFTLDHEFVHHVHLLRPDLYHGQPCLGGEPWAYVDFLGYYECIIPGRGE